MADSFDTKQVRFYILGSIRIEVDGVDQPIVGRQQRHVLALLIVAMGRPVSTDYLVDHLWPAEAPATARKTVQGFVHHIRSAVGDLLKTEQGGYSLDSVAKVDATIFEELVSSGRALDDPVAAVSRLRSALEMWTGTPLADLEDDGAFRAERARLEELHLSALEASYDARLRTGAVTELLPGLEGSVAAHPLRDRFRRQLMLALYRSGREAEALRVFQNYRAELAELGLEPPADTVRLERQIVQRDPALDADPVGTRSLRGYQILDRLGEGAFSVVYRGKQPSVGRDVAIKQIRAELANRPEFIRRFEAEAHMVARLEHPHIVPLIDYWREPGSAYLVMRLLRGGSLESSVLDGRWNLDRTVRMVDQIGAALAASHRADVVHRDVKSANILLDTDGNAYLSDFGIALEAAESADPDAALSAGSPAYASPEQLRREAVGASADVHGLAIAVYEALTGRLPFPDEPSQAALLQRQLHDPIPLIRSSRSDIPAGVDDVLQVATAKSAADRYRTISEFVEAMDAAAQPSLASNASRAALTSIASKERNPYKGLRAFDEADAADFAGRDRLVDKMTEVLDRERVVAVVGPSGSGKSSVVRAGLLPALRRGELLGSDEWLVVTILPGARPFEELEAGLTRIAAEQPIGLMDILQDSERGIGRAIRNVLPEHGQLLLVIDQFEELFTLCPDEAKRRLFLDGIASALSQERSRLRVVLTLRADFYDRPLRYDSIGRLVRDSTVAVLPLAADELEHAIVDPAAAVGAEFEPGLVSELVADVSDQPGALPMLQYALTELYERRISGLITRDAYQKLGGVTGVLSLRAEELYSASDEAEQVAARRVFGRLVSLGDGAEDTRRRALRSELAVSDASEAIIERFGSARLLSFDTDPSTREPTVEVAHEALLREWPRLGRWLEEDRDELRLMRHLKSSAAEWDSTDRPDSELYRGGRLESAQDWAAENPTEPAALERAFLAASTARRIAEDDAERRTSRRLRRLLIGVGVIAVFALVAGAVAVQQQQRAVDQTDLAEVRLADAELSAEAAEAQTKIAEENADLAQNRLGEAEAARAEAEEARTDAEIATIAASDEAFAAETGRLVGLSGSLAGDKPRQSLLAAVAAFRRGESPETLGALQRALVESTELVSNVRWGVEYLDVEWISATRAIGVRRDALELIDLTTNETIDTVPINLLTTESLLSPTAKLSDASTSGAWFVVATDETTVQLFSVADGFIEQFALEMPRQIAAVSVASDGRVVSVDVENRVSGFGRDGTLLFSVDVDDHATWADQIRSFPTVPALFNVVFEDLPVVSAVSAFDNTLLVSTASMVRRLSWSGELVEGPMAIVDSGLGVGTARDVHVTEAGDIIFNGTRSLSRVAFGDSLPVDIATSAFEGKVGAGAPGVAASAYRRGELIAAFDDGSVVRFDAINGLRRGVINLKLGPARSISLSPSGGQAVVAHLGGLTIISLDGTSALASSIPRAPTETTLSITTDGGVVINGPPGGLGAVSVWKRTGTGYEDVDLGFGDLNFFVMALPDDPIITWWYFPDAESIATDSSRTRFLDPTNLSVMLDRLPIPAGVVGDNSRDRDLALSMLVFPSRLFVSNFSTAEILAEIELETLDPFAVGSVARFDPADERVLVANVVGQALLYDVDTWTPIDNDVVATADISVGHWNRDGSLIATGSSAGQISIRDGETFEILKTLTGAVGTSNSWGAGSLFFSADDRHLLTNFDGPGRLWDLDTGQQIGVEFPNLATLLSGANSGDELHLVTAGPDSTLVWNLNTDEWIDIACRTAGSNFTEDEWAQWGPRDQDPYELCPIPEAA